MQGETGPTDRRPVAAIIVDTPRLGPQPERPAVRHGQVKRRKHVPQRTCVACRDKTSKRTLTRIVRTPEGTVEIDPSGKRNGRGAYLCSDPACWTKALTTPTLSRALKAEIDDDARTAMTTHLATLPDEAND